MQDTRRPPELSPDSPEIEKSLREELFALRVAHESALADLRAKDERIHELEYDFAVVHTKYENAKDYLKRLLWNELPPDVAGLRPLRELATMEHMPPLWVEKVFPEALSRIGHTCLVLTQWRDPLALRRTWCLYELLCTVLRERRPWQPWRRIALPSHGPNPEAQCSSA